MNSRTAHLGCGVLATEYSDGTAELKFTDLEDLQKRLGPRILRGLVQLLTARDHVRSVIHLMHLNFEHVAEGSPPRARNLTTMVLVKCGLLREISRVLELLRRAGIKGRVPADGAWSELEERIIKWNNEPRFIQLRDKAFHFDDAEVYDRGIEALIRDGEIVVSRGGSPRDGDWRDELGISALVRGMGLDNEAAFTAVLGPASEDLERMPRLIDRLFLDLLRSS